ncbi:MAG: malate dehydrogenase (quinone), partial [Pseudomonas capeferrum]
MFKKAGKTLLGLAVAASVMQAHAAETKKVDVLLVGGGIMSSTLAVWLHELEPSWSMEMVERLDGVAEESSNGWNNAGTGHSALAELNYTPEDKDGNVNITKAIEINEAFQISRQFWSWQVRQGVLKNPHSFINSTPHMSFVWGDDNIKFLKKRYDALQASPLFRPMQYSEDHAQIAKWVPLMMEGRDPNQKLAVTWTPIGTDVNFGEITRQFVGHLKTQDKFDLKLSSEVQDITRNKDGSWHVEYKNLKDGTESATDAKFLFIGAGGGALKLLQKSGIPEAKEYAGFPVGGSFLVTENPTVAMQHMAKAYGIASTGAPPMSVPHLDTRVVDGETSLLFGPFATFSPKFLKNGSMFDLVAQVRPGNLWPMMKVAIDNPSLITYLVGELLKNHAKKVDSLRTFVPTAKDEDWELIQAGQRAQVMKKDPDKGGVLQFGTEVVTGADGLIAGLLGASPGASTAVSIMLGLLQTCFPDHIAEWEPRLRELIPTYGDTLNARPEVAAESLTE